MARACRAAGATRSRAEDCGSIDGHWFATPLDHGWFGILVQPSFLFLLLVYCVVASITQSNLGDAPAYLLELVVAASLLAPEASRRVR